MVNPRLRWIVQQDEKHDFLKWNLLGIAGLLRGETIYSFINSLDHLTIIGTEASINSFLSFHLGKNLEQPRWKNSPAKKLIKEAHKNRIITEDLKTKLSDLGKKLQKGYKMPSTMRMINEAFKKELITDNLKKKLSNFLNIRHQIIHPKSPFGSLFLGSKTDQEIPHYWEGEDALELIKSLKNAEFLKGGTKAFQCAKEGLEAYFQLINQVKSKLTKIDE